MDQFNCRGGIMLKKYIKPTWEFVELRPEESLAKDGSGGRKKGNCAFGARKCQNHSHYPKW
jgi:hypothetical protein